MAMMAPPQNSLPTPQELLSAALAYADRGWRVIPLHYPIWNADGTIRCSCPKREACGKNTGKHPLHEAWPTLASCDKAQVEAWWKDKPHANIGIVTGKASGVAVVDVDPRNGGAISLEELHATYGPFPATPQVLTGGVGGTHNYFASNADLPSGKLAAGIDFQADTTHFVVAPPSLHQCGRQYCWEASSDPDDIPLAPLPEWIRVLAEQKAREYTALSITLPADLPVIDVSTLKVSRRMQGVIRTGGDPKKPYPSRSEAVFGVLCALSGAGYDDATLAAVCLDPANGISDRPLSVKNSKSPRYQEMTRGYMADEIRRVRAKAKPPQGKRDMPMMGQASNGTASGTATSQGAGVLLRCDKKDIPYPDAGNVRLVFREHPEWKGRLWHDLMSGQPMLGDAPLSDADVCNAAAWMGDTLEMSIRSIGLVRNVMQTVCWDQKRDLLREAILALPAWDSIERLTSWASDHCGADECAYTQFVSRTLLVAMVARAMQPGCQQRFVFVFCGKQNSGKSSLVRLLAGNLAWYVDLSDSLDGKEAHMQIQGKWLAELGELDAMGRTRLARMKAFITMPEDTWIPKYSNLQKSVPRRTILIGTTNEAEFLQDATGNTRYLPLQMGDDAYDLTNVAQQRDQLLAEALQWWQAHQSDWWIIDDGLQLEVTEKQDARRIPTVYEDDLAAWLRDNGHTEVSFAYIAQHYLSLPKSEWADRSKQTAIGITMTALGWRKEQQRTDDGKRTRVWRRP